MNTIQYSFPWLHNNITLLFFMKIFAARVVGGAVRNAILQTMNEDVDIDLEEFDLATMFTPQEMLDIAKRFKLKSIPTGIEHGTITMLGRKLDEQYIIDIQPNMQTEQDKIAFEYIKNNLHLQQKLTENVQLYEFTTLRIDVETDGRHAIVAFTDNWKEDAARRDFTINAMYVDQDGMVYDYFNGLEDIKQYLIRFVGDPNKRIQEDYLRIFRFFRFNAHYGKANNIDKACIEACVRNMAGLKNVAQERLLKEMYKLMQAKNPWPVLLLMEECGLYDCLQWPKLNAKKVEKMLNFAAENNMRLSVLGRFGLFDGSWDVLKMSKKQQQYLKQLQAVNTTKAQWLADLYQNDLQFIHDKILCQEVQCDVLQDYNENAKFEITGQNIMQVCHIPAGPQVGKILQDVFCWWCECDMYPSKEECLEYAKRIRNNI